MDSWSDSTIMHSATSMSNLKSKTDREMDFQEGSETVTERHKMSNRRVLPKDAETYRLETFKKNSMIIFKHENIEGFAPRAGTAHDVAALRETFEQFGFEIAVHDDLTKAKLFEELERCSKRDFTEYGCVAVVILTHGTGNGLLRARDEGEIYSEMDITNTFNANYNLTLISKPVMFLIQASRGNSSSRGVPVMAQYNEDPNRKEEDTDSSSKRDEETVLSYYLPVESDRLIVHSCFPGKGTFRTQTGSWFIQTLCMYIKKMYKTHDLESIIIAVKRDIAVNKYYMEYNYRSKEMDVLKQMPVVTSTLIRKLFLRKYEDGSSKVTEPSTGIEIQKEGSQKMIRQDQSKTKENIQKEESYDSTCTIHDGNYSCDCFLDQFNYMKKCLRLYLNKNPNDEIAEKLLAIANKENGKNGEKTKIVLATISSYLRLRYKGTETYKYIYFHIPGDADLGEDSDNMHQVD